MTNDLAAPSKHRLYEDLFAILIGTTLVSIGITFYAEATLITGSTAGLALLLQYETGVSFSILFFAINVPFYGLAALRMGWPFTVKTIASVMLVSFLSAMMPQWLYVSAIEPLFAALAGGTLIGLGVLSLFRHKASVGGINILALFLQNNFGIRAGYFQLAVDGAILFAALFILPIDRVLLSILGAVALNLIVALNHRPGRYIGFS